MEFPYQILSILRYFVYNCGLQSCILRISFSNIVDMTFYVCKRCKQIFYSKKFPFRYCRWGVILFIILAYKVVFIEFPFHTLSFILKSRKDLWFMNKCKKIALQLPRNGSKSYLIHTGSSDVKRY